MLRPIYIYWLKYKCDHLKRAHFGSNFTSRLIFILFLIIRLNLFFSSTFPYVFICRFDFSYFSCLTFPPFFEVLPGSCYVIKKGIFLSSRHTSLILIFIWCFLVCSSFLQWCDDSFKLSIVFIFITFFFSFDYYFLVKIQTRDIVGHKVSWRYFELANNGENPKL